MSINEILERYLAGKRSAGEDYSDKLRPFSTSDETSLWDVSGDDAFQQSLRDAGLTKGQRAGISSILGNAGHVVNRDTQGRHVESYMVTVGDVKGLSDDNLRKLTGEKGAKVLRTLFGTSPGGEEER